MSFLAYLEFAKERECVYGIVKGVPNAIKFALPHCIPDKDL